MVVVGAGGGGPVAADDPRDLFGFGDKPRQPPPGCGEATQVPCPRRDGAAPAAIETYLTRAYLRRQPVGEGDARYGADATLGATVDDAGPSWSGASSLDNAWMLDGAPIGSPLYGTLDARVPLDFVAGIRTRVAGFSARDPAQLGATIDVELREGGHAHQGSARAWLGGGLRPTELARDRGFRAFEARYADYRLASAVGVVDGPLAALTGADSWYVLGVAPTVRDHGLAQRVFRQVDVDADGTPDRDADGDPIHQEVAAPHRDALAYSVPILARAGLRVGRHAFTATALGRIGRTTRWRGIGEASAVGVDRDQRDLDLIGRWRATWAATTVTIQGSWHREDQRERPHQGSAGAPAIGFTSVPAPDAGAGLDAIDDQVRAACDDASAADPSPLIANCPFATGYYWTGGAGLLSDTVQDRPAVRADVEHRIGEHLLGVGVTGEDARVEQVQGYTGGFERRVLFADAFVDERLVRLGVGPAFTDDCGDQDCQFLDRASTTYRTRHLAAYVTDTWRPDEVVAVEYGVRAQQTQVGTALVLRDVLPRIGGAWDFLGGGRSRLFVGWGRYAQLLPAAMGYWLTPQPTRLQTVEFAGTSHELFNGTTLGVRDGVEGTRVDEVVAGIEVGLPDVLRLGTSVRQRHLGRALEDEGGEYVTAGDRGGTPATRDFTEVAAWLANDPGARLGVRLGYAWSRLRGNWPGPYDQPSGYGLYTSSLFDGGPGTGQENATGLLPNDQPHRFFAELSLRGRWRGFAVEGGLRASAQSGRPISARIGREQVFAIPRGSAGRLPLRTSANLHLGARRGRVTATLDVFNLFDRRGVLEVDDRYADAGRPILGGDRADLLWLKDDQREENLARVNPRYGEATRYQAPLAVLLGVGVDL